MATAKDEKKYRDPPFVETDVLEPEECRRGLRLRERKWYEIAPMLPASYVFGENSPRYVWGEILTFLKRTGAAAPRA